MWRPPRNRHLRLTLARAGAAHGRLRGRAAARERRNRATAQTFAASQRTSSNLQEANNDLVRVIGEQQDELAGLQDDNRKLTSFLAGATGGLVKASRDPSPDAVLAGLLAAEAYLATPYMPDDGAHPNVYNALWLALNRLDPAAARALIAPVSNPTGKLGTTSSKRMVDRICARAGRPLTEKEWHDVLPSAPYPPDPQACTSG